MRNAAAYASSTSTNFTEYEDLPGHHLYAIRNLIASPPDDSYPESAVSIADEINFFMDNFTAEEAIDYSGVRNPDTFRSFQLVAAYYLTCSEDSSEGDYDPTRECFMVELADGADEEASDNDGARRDPPPTNQVVPPPPANQGAVPPPDPDASSSWRNSRSSRRGSRRSVDKPDCSEPRSSRSAPCAVRELRQQDASPKSGSWPTAASHCN
jgi:hypothetical protein